MKGSTLLCMHLGLMKGSTLLCMRPGSHEGFHPAVHVRWVS